MFNYLFYRINTLHLFNLTNKVMNRRNFLKNSGKVILASSALYITGSLAASCSSDSDDSFNDGYYDDGYYDDGYYDDGYYDDGYYDDGYYDDGYYDDGYYGD